MAHSSYIVYTVLALLAYPLWSAFYNVYLHALSKIPGSPAIWTCSPLRFIYSLIAGTVVNDVQKLHQKYGPIVRISPNEVTFAAPKAWEDIFGRGFARDPLWWRSEAGKPQSIISAGTEDHQRMRKLLARGFTTQALREQEDIVQRYINLLVDRLHEQAAQNPHGFDIVPWMNFTTFDIFGDLGFGESFDCLQHSRYHPWIALLFNSVKAVSFIIGARYFPLVDDLLMRAIPKSLKDMKEAHFQQIADKVERRLNWELERPDLMSHIIRQNHADQAKGMSRGEMYHTFMVLTTAGSETTATCLSGIFNHLVTNRVQLDYLVKEVRTASTDGSFTISALDGLAYLSGVIQEGLRLCPPIPFMLPRVVPASGAEVGGVWLPGGTSVSLQAWSLYRDLECFHRASEFLPERWLPEALSKTSPFFHDQRHGFQPFNVGPHSCLGRHLAYAEMRLILAKVLWHFDLESTGNVVTWEDLRTYLLVEKKPVLVKLTTRTEQVM